MPFESAIGWYIKLSISSVCEFEALRTLLDHLLDRARRVDLHRKEVVEAIDFRRLLGELLAKRVGQIVCWIRRLALMVE